MDMTAKLTPDKSRTSATQVSPSVLLSSDKSVLHFATLLQERIAALHGAGSADHPLVIIIPPTAEQQSQPKPDEDPPSLFLPFTVAMPSDPPVAAYAGSVADLVLDNLSDVRIERVKVTDAPRSRWALKVNNGQTVMRLWAKDITATGLTEYGMYLGGVVDAFFEDVYIDRTSDSREHGLRIANSQRVAFVKGARRNFIGGPAKSAVWIVSCLGFLLRDTDLGEARRPAGAIRLGARPDVYDNDGISLHKVGDRQGGRIKRNGEWLIPPPRSTKLFIENVKQYHNGNDNHALCVWPGPEDISVKEYYIHTGSGKAIHFDSRWSGTAVLSNVRVNDRPLTWSDIDAGGLAIEQLKQRVTISHD